MKRAKIDISVQLLKDILDIEGRNLQVINAQISRDRLGKEKLELIVEGESLQETFRVQEGQQIKQALVIARKTVIETEIVPYNE